MADKAPVVHIGENSPEHVALKLLINIAYAEKKHFYPGLYDGEKPSRKWLLDTYAECLEAVRGDRQR
jgi:hypothetical protein